MGLRFGVGIVAVCAAACIVELARGCVVRDRRLWYRGALT